MNPDAVPVQDLQQVVACVAALTGLGGILWVLVAMERRLAPAALALLAAFASFLVGGLLGVRGMPFVDLAWSGRVLAGACLVLPVGVLLATAEGKRRERALKRAIGDAEALRREVERLSGTNVRLEDELQAQRRRVSALEKEGPQSDVSRTAREAGALRQRKAVEAAQASERKHRSIFEGAHEGMAMLERETLRLVHVNPSLVRMTGYDAEELGKRTLVDLFGGGPRQPGRADLQRSAREGRAITVEIQRKDGGATWADVSVSVIGVGAEAQLLTVVRDVSERRLLEQELQLNLSTLRERERRLEVANGELAEHTAAIEQMNLRLQELQEQKDHFVSTVSHELRTPLTSIRSFSEILLKHGETEPELRREFLTIITKECERLTRLVNNVLDLARIEAGETRLELSEFDLADVVADALNSTCAMAQERQVSIRFESGGEPRPLWADRDKIQQVLMNLVSNAVKYSPEGGEVELHVRAGDGKGTVEICVVDHGPGIPPSELERVFEKFRRTDDAAASGAPGTGLGLAICREIAKLHGGRVWAESDGEHGSRFRVELPDLAEGRRLLGPARPHQTPPTEAHDHGPSPRVGRPTGIALSASEPPSAPVLEPVTAGRDDNAWSETGSLPPLPFGDSESRAKRGPGTGELPPMR